MAVEVLGWGHQIMQIRIGITKFIGDNPAMVRQDKNCMIFATA